MKQILKRIYKLYPYINNSQISYSLFHYSKAKLAIGFHTT